MHKCSYCNKADAENRASINIWNGIGESNQDFYYCSDVCRKSIEDFAEYENRNATRFLILIVITVLTMVMANGLLPDLALLIVNIATFVLGIILLKYPFATPLTNQWLGIQKAVWLVRILGVLIGLLGLWDVLKYYELL